MNIRAACVAAVLLSAVPRAAFASGHGPVFGATTPTLGKGGWSLDTAWTLRTSEAAPNDQMLKSMISFGVTENLQLSASLPLATTSGALPGARMMSLMSNDRELEVLAGYRFQRRVIGIGGRQESTVYAGGTVPLESMRGGVQTSPSLYVGGATGYASRSHYLWVGAGLQHFTETNRDQLGATRFASIVYGFRPRPLRVEAHKPDARVFVEATAEDRDADRLSGVRQPTGARSVFVGPTTLVLYKAFAFEAGVLFPAYQRVDSGRSHERLRVAANVSYFFWLK
jgi:hypothetical protein